MFIRKLKIKTRYESWILSYQGYHYFHFWSNLAYPIIPQGMFIDLCGFFFVKHMLLHFLDYYHTMGHKKPISPLNHLIIYRLYMGKPGKRILLINQTIRSLYTKQSNIFFVTVPCNANFAIVLWVRILQLLYW